MDPTDRVITNNYCIYMYVISGIVNIISTPNDEKYYYVSFWKKIDVTSIE